MGSLPATPCPKCGLIGGVWVTHVCNVPLAAPATTLGAMTAEQWKAAWMKAEPVVTAAKRFVNAEAEGNEALITDAHTQLLRALTDYYAPEQPSV